MPVRDNSCPAVTRDRMKTLRVVTERDYGAVVVVDSNGKRKDGMEICQVLIT